MHSEKVNIFKSDHLDGKWEWPRIGCFWDLSLSVSWDSITSFGQWNESKSVMNYLRIKRNDCKNFDLSYFQCNWGSTMTHCASVRWQDFCPLSVSLNNYHLLRWLRCGVREEGHDCYINSLRIDDRWLWRSHVIYSDKWNTINSIIS